IPAPPLTAQLVHLREAYAVRRLARQWGMALVVDDARARAGATILFSHGDEYAGLVVEVAIATRDVRVVASHRYLPDRITAVVALVRRWSHGLWCVDVTRGRSTWIGSAVQAPSKTRPLLTTDECITTYFQIAEHRGDVEGKLAAFMKK